jgi:hypothetical protein
VVLAELSDPAYGLGTYPLIAWQRYGTGKSMFVGTDRLWRLRYKVGDEYHTRFWIQSVQFLGLSRLLGENKRVRIETDKTLYDIGSAVHMTVDALDEAYEPLSSPSYTVYVRRVEDQQSAPVTLKPVPDAPGLYHAVYVPRRTGRYEVAAGEERTGQANTTAFDVRPSNVEQTETAMQKDLLVKMAEITGGAYCGLLDLPKLESRIAAKKEPVVVNKEFELWDTWAVVAVFMLLVGFEWFLRRQNGLA